VKPTVGRIVHYVSYGTPGGEYTSQCRAAIITEVGAWVTVDDVKAASYSTSEGRPIRTLEQWFYADAVALSVFNPTGMFFNGAGTVACKYDEGGTSDTPGAPAARSYAGGTWHWPEREDS
jgi:hypothetical protein